MARIEAEEDRRLPVLGMAASWLRGVYSPARAAFVGALALFLIGVFMARPHEGIKAPSSTAPVDYAAELIVSTFDEESESRIGTSVEEYFL